MSTISGLHSLTAVTIELLKPCTALGFSADGHKKHCCEYVFICIVRCISHRYYIEWCFPCSASYTYYTPTIPDFHLLTDLNNILSRNIISYVVLTMQYICTICTCTYINATTIKFGEIALKPMALKMICHYVRYKRNIFTKKKPNLEIYV